MLNVGSCRGRCGEDYDRSNPCHCNSRCQEFNNCCSDYKGICLSGGACATSTGSSVSGKELSCLAQLLWDGDVNRASSSQYTLNLQGKIARHELDHHEDQASANLFTYMDEATLFAKDTYSAYVALIDNYVARTGTHEEVTSQETAEINAFLDVIQGTDVIIKLHEFLANKGNSDMATFMADLKEMWFGLYSRSGGRALDSSGFEHVFLGEFKRGKVSGFHNWITAYLLEKDGLADYYGYIWDKEVRFFPGILAAQLRWGSLYKDLGSMFYGTSPEFDLAMYTMCYVTNPDRMCRFDMAGASVAIQTWSWGKSSYGDGKKYLASAYPA
uniref:Uridylate-specific endoribonuclease n=1 Tax=Branchiostoma floridae TaxID=7739 RepID=C3YPU7_BRAFL|eukprot:XP_002601869.1 hypothetical protein BRAFLDRAFT_215427 [Branchiostoma floridae]